MHGLTPACMAPHPLGQAWVPGFICVGADCPLMILGGPARPPPPDASLRLPLRVCGAAATASTQPALPQKLRSQGGRSSTSRRHNAASAAERVNFTPASVALMREKQPRLLPITPQLSHAANSPSATRGVGAKVRHVAPYFTKPHILHLPPLARPLAYVHQQPWRPGQPQEWRQCPIHQR